MKKVLVSLLIGVSLLSVGCGGVKTHKEGYLNINTDIESCEKQLYEGRKVIGEGVIGTTDMGGYGIRYMTRYQEGITMEDFIAFDYNETSNIFEEYNLKVGDHVYFEGVLNGYLIVEDIEVID